MPRVSFERIHKAYGAVTVLKDLDLAVDHGDFLVLLGPSGCGKTTLLNMLAGLQDVTDGRILIGDRDVTDLAPDVLRHRLVLSYDALADGVRADDLIARVLERVRPQQSTRLVEVA